jgi:hypothetical protein
LDFGKEESCIGTYATILGCEASEEIRKQILTQYWVQLRNKTIPLCIYGQGIWGYGFLQGKLTVVAEDRTGG